VGGGGGAKVERHKRKGVAKHPWNSRGPRGEEKWAISKGDGQAGRKRGPGLPGGNSHPSRTGAKRRGPSIVRGTRGKKVTH